MSCEGWSSNGGTAEQKVLCPFRAQPNTVDPTLTTKVHVGFWCLQCDSLAQSSVAQSHLLCQFWLDTSTGYLSSSMLFLIANIVLTQAHPSQWRWWSLTNLIGVSIFRQSMNGSSDSLCMLFLSPASEPPTLFVEDVLFTLYVAPWFALPARPPSSPTSTDQSGPEPRSWSSQQPASFLCCFTSGPVVLGPCGTIFSWSQLPKPEDMFALCASRHRPGSLWPVRPFMSSVLKAPAVWRNVADVSFGTFTSMTCKTIKNGSFLSRSLAGASMLILVILFKEVITNDLLFQIWFQISFPVPCLLKSQFNAFEGRFWNWLFVQHLPATSSIIMRDNTDLWPVPLTLPAVREQVHFRAGGWIFPESGFLLVSHYV